MTMPKVTRSVQLSALGAVLLQGRIQGRREPNASLLKLLVRDGHRFHGVACRQHASFMRQGAVDRSDGNRVGVVSPVDD